MKYNFDEMIDRKGTHAMKLEAMPKGNAPDALSVWVADMDFQCAEPILKALHDRIDRKIFGYTLYNSDELMDAVTGWFKRRYDWDVPREQIVYSPGIVPALGILLQALTEEGDGIIIQRPVYYPFSSKIKGNKRTLVNNSLLYEDGKYTIDYADLDEKFGREDVKGLIFCSPHNPVGRVWTVEELEKVVEIAKKHDKWIISDEIHMDLTRKGVTHTPMMKIAGDYANKIITCTAPSKTFNLAGMQISNIVIPDEEMRNKYKEVAEDKLSLGVASPFGVEANIAAYNEGEEWLDQVRDYLDGNFEYIYDFVSKELPMAKVTHCEGTYLCWIDLTAYGIEYKELEKLMQTEAKIAFDEGYIFGEEGYGFERINVATPRANIEKVMSQMKKALDAYQAKKA